MLDGLDFDIRYLHPIELAKSLYMQPNELPREIKIKRHRKNLINLVSESGYEEAYLIPIENLGYLEIPSIIEMDPKKLNDEDLIKYHRISEEMPYSDELVKRATKKVMKMAYKFKDIMDKFGLEGIISAGKVGYLDAVNMFDFSRGIKFDTYVSKRVHGEIQDYLRSLDEVPRIIRKVSKRIKNDSNVKDILNGNLNLKEIARGYGESEESVTLAINLIKNPQQKQGLYIDSLNGDKQDLNPNIKNQDLNHTDFNRAEYREILEIGIACLNKVERKIMYEHHLGGKTMREVGVEVGLSESRISQLNNNLLERVRDSLIDHGYNFETIFEE